MYRVKIITEYPCDDRNELEYSLEYDHLEQAVAYVVDCNKFDFIRYNNWRTAYYLDEKNFHRTFYIIQYKEDEVWKDLDEENCEWSID